MTTANATERVIASAQAVTMANRPNDRFVEIPRDLPGIVIFIHGVNDPGEGAETLEQGLCMGLNERLGRSDLKPGDYGVEYLRAKRDAKGGGINDRSVAGLSAQLGLYKRSDNSETRSFFIPFYWGYRAENGEIAMRENMSKSARRNASFDAEGKLLVRGQYQDIHGNWLDEHFSKEGGFFANATNNIPDMYGAGFVAGSTAKIVTKTGLSGRYSYIGHAAPRKYFVLAAERLATLLDEIRQREPNDTVTIIGHSQGTLITLLAQAILVQRGKPCVDCAIMVDTPYSVYTTKDSSQQTGRAKLQTLINIVNAITKTPHSVPELADMLLDGENSTPRAGPKWKPTVGVRKNKQGTDFVTFSERDNRGKVYLYFCPEDTTVGLRAMQGLGTFGVPDRVNKDGLKHSDSGNEESSIPAMETLKTMNFFQRMWTRLERDGDGSGAVAPVLVGDTPGAVEVRTDGQRLTPGPNTGLGNKATNWATQDKHRSGVAHFINGEALNPPHAPEMYGGETVQGGQTLGKPDVAGKLAPDDVAQQIALGNRHASFGWKDVEVTKIFPNVNDYKAKFNAEAGDDKDKHSYKWRAVAMNDPRHGYTVQREMTPAEAKEWMSSSAEALSDNSYHSAILSSKENHRWVTAMDVAVGQAKSLDDPGFREALIAFAEWRYPSEMEDKAWKAVQRQLSAGAIEQFNQTITYFRSGIYPEFADSAVPQLVVDESVGEIR
jgi:pimeloyl-ACP methyl ester carboxylesterase